MKNAVVVLGLASGILAPWPDVRAAWSFLEYGPPLHTYASAHDEVRGRLLLFGGADGQIHRNETLAFDLANQTWVEVTTSSARPSPRRLVEGLYDPASDRFVVFGGVGDDGFHNDVWALSLSGTPTWTQLRPSGPRPSPRAGHSVVLDPVRRRMIVFGGYDPAVPGSFRNDLWALSLTGKPVWRRLVPVGEPPSRRSSHSAVYDAKRRRMLVFGGGFPDVNDVWALSLEGAPAWSRIDVAGAAPSPREEPVAIYDPVRDRLVIHGGYADVQGPYFDDTWILSLDGVPAWSRVPDEIAPPPARWGHGAIYTPLGDRLVFHGGQRSLIDTWALALGELVLQ